MRDQKKWDMRYLSLAKYWATLCSKDPSTIVGAVVVSADGQREYLGYNGFPRGVHDSEERLNTREVKYQMVVHAEANALLKAGADARGGTLYCNLFTCNECAKLVIQSGIKRVVSSKHAAEERWAGSQDIAWIMYGEAGVEAVLV